MTKSNQNRESEFYPVALTIAGSDSGGGAGVQADLRTFSAFGVFGTSAITAVTAQNPREVRGVEPLPPACVGAQIQTVSASFAVRAVKTGMLHSKNIIAEVADALGKLDASLVVDPVMISGSGARLLDPDAVDAMKSRILPLADWITPNIPEAEALIGRSVATIDDMELAAAEIANTYSAGCVLKGGHLPDLGDDALDVVAYKGKIHHLVSPSVEFSARVADTITHGTGCTFSAAIAAGIAIELPWNDMLIAAKAFVFGSLSEAVTVGDDLAGMFPPSGNHRDKVRLSQK
jgi:hydroxymethylpyrimidine/phosphomethylpyrimidine kinase